MGEESIARHIAFTETVKQLQARNGSCGAYAKMEKRGWPNEITPQLADFIAQQNSFYLATVNAEGQPYIQHRGGPRGFLMDYANRRRIKIWGEAWMVEGDEALLKAVMPEGYAATPERALLFKVHAWDPNCPQHIPRKYDLDQVEEMMADRDSEIAALKVQIAELEAAR